MSSFERQCIDVLTQHPLMPEGYRFMPSDGMLVTEWGEVLPGVEFSRQQLDHMKELATTPQLTTPTELVVLARYLQSKLSFDEAFGCWRLPLQAEYDSGGRARYPTVNIKELGMKGFLAHRATAKIFGGQDIFDENGSPHHIDHICRVHSCCNPYHLEAVTHAENVRRGSDARRRQKYGELFQLPAGQITVAQLVAISSGI